MGAQKAFYIPTFTKENVLLTIPTTRADEGCARTRANLREMQLAYAPSALDSCTKSLPLSCVRAFGAAKAARASIRARNLGSAKISKSY